MFKQISKNIFVLFGENYSCNCYLLKSTSSNALIDSGLPSSLLSIKEFLEAQKVKPESTETILHTHGHLDHFGADLLFKKAKIRMDWFDASFVEKRDEQFTAFTFFPASSSFPKISSYLKEGEIISIPPFKLKVISTPGHTKGSTCFLEEKQKILFSGDTLFKKSIGRTDLPSGSIEDMRSSIQKLEKLKFSILCPGHGEILEGKELQKKNFAIAKELLK